MAQAGRASWRQARGLASDRGRQVFRNRAGRYNGHILGYTVRKANGKEFEFGGLLPRSEAIVAAVEELDPPAADRTVP
jgi:hypothetical protein